MSLAAGALGLPAATRQLLDQAVAVIALDLDAAVAARTARAATLLEFRREGFQFNRRQAEAGDHRDALALASLGLAADAHGAVTGSLTWSAALADAFPHRALAIRTALADAGGIDDARVGIALSHDPERTR